MDLDQRRIIAALRSLKVPVFHALFHAKTAIKMMADGCLYVNGCHVSVAYFHIGYSPDQFTRADWDRRELVERSNAVKVPSVRVRVGVRVRVTFRVRVRVRVRARVRVRVRVRVRG